MAEGDLDGATEALARSASMDPPPPPWTYAWLSGSVNRQQGNLREAADSLRSVLQTRVPERKFDFSKDYIVRNELGLTLLDLAQQAEVLGDDEGFEQYLRQAETEFLTVLETDVENATAYANLAQIYSLLGEEAKADEHRRRHQRYKPDDNAPEIAVPAARAKYPAANHAAEDLVIYDLQREGAADVDWQD